MEFKIKPGVNVALGFYDFSNEPVSEGVTDILGGPKVGIQYTVYSIVLMVLLRY